MFAHGSGGAAQIRVTTVGTRGVTWEASLVRDESLAGLLTGWFKPEAPTPPSELQPVGKWTLRFDDRAIDDLWIAVDWSVPTSP